MQCTTQQYRTTQCNAEGGVEKSLIRRLNLNEASYQTHPQEHAGEPTGEPADFLFEIRKHQTNKLHRALYSLYQSSDLTVTRPQASDLGPPNFRARAPLPPSQHFPSIQSFELRGFGDTMKGIKRRIWQGAAYEWTKVECRVCETMISTGEQSRHEGTQKHRQNLYKRTDSVSTKEPAGKKIKKDIKIEWTSRSNQQYVVSTLHSHHSQAKLYPERF